MRNRPYPELSDTSQLPNDIDLGPAALQAPSGCTDARLLLSSGPRSMSVGSCAARSCRLRERLLDPPRGPGNGLEPRWRCSAGLLAPYRTHSRQPRAPAPSCELLASSVRDAASRSDGHTRISSVTSSALAACAPGSAPLSSSRRRVGTTPSLEARGRRRSSRRRSLEAPGRRDWGSCGARRCPMAASAVPGSACGSGQRSLSCAVSEQTHLRTRARDAHSCVCRDSGGQSKMCLGQSDGPKYLRKHILLSSRTHGPRIAAPPRPCWRDVVGKV